MVNFTLTPLAAKTWGDANYASIGRLFVVKGCSVFVPISQNPKADLRLHPVAVRSGEKPLQPIRKQKKNGIS
jgi:hypothetical protein